MNSGMTTVGRQVFGRIVCLIVIGAVYYRGFHRTLDEISHAIDTSFLRPKPKPTIQRQQDNHSRAKLDQQEWSKSHDHDDQIITRRIDSASRIWEPMDLTKVCFQNMNDQLQKNPGLVYVKVPKTSSSTCAGLNIRIAHKVGERTGTSAGALQPPKDEDEEEHVDIIPSTSSSTMSTTNIADTTSKNISTGSANNATAVCSHTMAHGRDKLLHRRKESLLWTFIRDPAARALSSFYHFKVSRLRGGAVPSDDTVIRYLKRMQSFQFRYIVDHPNHDELQKEQEQHRLDDFQIIRRYVMHSYDFIGLVERREESLSVMKILWGLDIRDMIVLSAKQSGGYDDGKFKQKCFKIKKPTNVSQAVQDYLHQKFPRNNYDYELYSIVDRSLDMTIDYLGRDRVEREVERLHAVQNYAEEQCLESTIFPCSSNGTRQTIASNANCYNSDFGCGYPCVDRVLKDNEDYVS